MQQFCFVRRSLPTDHDPEVFCCLRGAGGGEPYASLREPLLIPALVARPCGSAADHCQTKAQRSPKLALRPRPPSPRMRLWRFQLRSSPVGELRERFCHDRTTVMVSCVGWFIQRFRYRGAASVNHRGPAPPDHASDGTVLTGQRPFSHRDWSRRCLPCRLYRLEHTLCIVRM